MHHVRQGRSTSSSSSSHGEAVKEVNDRIEEMIKQSVNEPSRGLYFVQQHVHKAVPAIVSLKDQIGQTTANVELNIEDSRDAIAAVKCMKEVGPPSIDRMLKLVANANQHLQHPRKTTGETLSRPNAAPTSIPKPPSYVPITGAEAATYVKNMWDTALETASTVTRRSSSFDARQADVTPGSSSDAQGPSSPATSSPATAAAAVRSAFERAGSIISEGAGSPSALLDAVQVKPGRYVRAVMDTLGRRTSPPAAGSPSEGILAPASSAPAIVATSAGEDLDSLADVETFDKFQAESAAKLEEWLRESPPSTLSESQPSTDRE